MATITSLGASDNGSTSRTTINDNFTNLNTDKIETSVISTDGTLAGNSDTELPSEKAVKTYVDASITAPATWQLIETKTFGSDTTETEFTGLSAYSSILFVCNAEITRDSSSAGTLIVTVSDDNGSTYKSTGYGASSLASTDTAITISNSLGTGVLNAFCKIDLFNTTAPVKPVTASYQDFTGDGSPIIPTALDAIKIALSSAVNHRFLTGESVSLYGIIG